MLKPSTDLGLGIVVVVLAALGAFALIPLGIVLPDGIDISALSPDFWPLIIMGVLAVAGLFVILQSALALRRNGDATPALGTEEAEEAEELYPWPRQAIHLGAVVVWLLLLYVVIPETGMAPAAVATLAFLAWFAGERRWKLILPIAILLPIALYLFFVYVANVPLPVGVFEAWR